MYPREPSDKSHDTRGGGCCRCRRSLSTESLPRDPSTHREDDGWLRRESRGCVQRAAVRAGPYETSRNRNPRCPPRCCRWLRVCGGRRFRGPCPSKHTLGLAKAPIPDVWVQTIPRQQIHLISQSLLQKVLHRDEIDQ